MGIEDTPYHEVPVTDVYISNENVEHDHQSSKIPNIKRNLTYGFLLLLIAIQSIAIALQYANSHKACTSINGLNLKRTHPRTIYQPSPYTSLNTTIADLAWDSILPGHGVISVPSAYALQKNLPPSLPHPHSAGNSIYVIEAYHAIHCIKTLRKHYLALRANTPQYWSLAHDAHCFDALRQYVMCNVDDTLLYTWGKRDSGHGQEKLCGDWDALRSWAEERSMGYLDTEPGMGRAHLGERWDGDGLPVGALS